MGMKGVPKHGRTSIKSNWPSPNGPASPSRVRTQAGACSKLTKVGTVRYRPTLTVARARKRYCLRPPPMTDRGRAGSASWTQAGTSDRLRVQRSARWTRDWTLRPARWWSWSLLSNLPQCANTHSTWKKKEWCIERGVRGADGGGALYHRTTQSVR